MYVIVISLSWQWRPLRMQNIGEHEKQKHNTGGRKKRHKKNCKGVYTSLLPVYHRTAFFLMHAFYYFDQWSWTSVPKSKCKLKPYSYNAYTNTIKLVLYQLIGLRHMNLILQHADLHHTNHVEKAYQKVISCIEAQLRNRATNQKQPSALLH